jgi:hypothetical protein
MAHKNLEYNGTDLKKEKTLEFYSIGPNAELNIQGFRTGL